MLVNRKLLILATYMLVFLQVIMADNTGATKVGHPVYAFLDSMQIQGVVSPQITTKPYQRTKVLEKLKEIENKVLDEKVQLSTNEYILLQSFISEFSSDPLFRRLSSWEGGSLSLGLPQTVSVLWGADTRGQDASELVYQNTILVGIQLSDVFLGVDNQIEVELITQDTDAELWKISGAGTRADYYMYTWNLDLGTGGFNHTGTIPNGQSIVRFVQNGFSELSYESPFVVLGLSRNSPDWGPSSLANLVLSQTSKAYENLNVMVPFGDVGALSWVTGFIEDYETRILKTINAHRLEWVPLPNLRVAMTESIIYNRRFELSYLNPLSLYYGAEVRNGDLDNKLGGIDASLFLPSIKSGFYVSLFADDWDISELLNFSYYHNIGAYQLGWQSASLFAPGIQTTLEYTYLSHWMYTHVLLQRGGYDETYSFNNYAHYGQGIGHTLQPNSHQIVLQLRKNWNSRSQTMLDLGLVQHGTGDLGKGVGFEEADGTILGWDLGGLYLQPSPFSYMYLDIGKEGAVLESKVRVALSQDLKFAKDSMHLKLETGLMWVQNQQNIVDNGRLKFNAGVSFTYNM